MDSCDRRVRAYKNGKTMEECKAIAESDPQGKESLFEGLNSGILYLMGVPYLLLSIALVYIYINRKKVL